MRYKVTRNVGSVRKYRSWKQWDEGDFVVVKVLADYTDSYGHTGWECEVLEANFEQPEFQLKDGQKEIIREGDIIGLNHTGSLAYKMTALGKELGIFKRDPQNEPIMTPEGLPVYEVPKGTLLMISYLGREKLMKGRFKGTLAHSLEVSLVEPEEEKKSVSI